MDANTALSVDELHAAMVRSYRLTYVLTKATQEASSQLIVHCVSTERTYRVSAAPTRNRASDTRSQPYAIHTQAGRLIVSQLDKEKKPASRAGSLNVGGDNQLTGTSCLGLSSVPPRYTQYGALVRLGWIRVRGS
eukprot:scaffold26708_cov57-Phaeocystis_antarctica.AAC.2